MYLKQRTNSKKNTKRRHKHKIDTYVQQSWTAEVSSKSSLAYRNLHDYSVGRVHWSWKSTDHNTCDVHRDLIKVKVLTGVYILQCNSANMLSVRFNVCAGVLTAGSC